MFPLCLIQAEECREHPNNLNWHRKKSKQTSSSKSASPRYCLMQIDLTLEQHRTQAISNGFTENISSLNGFEATIEHSNGFGENHKHWMFFLQFFLKRAKAYPATVHLPLESFASLHLRPSNATMFHWNVMAILTSTPMHGRLGTWKTEIPSKVHNPWKNRIRRE